MRETDNNFSNDTNGYYFKFKNIGMMETEDIFEAGYSKLWMLLHENR